MNWYKFSYTAKHVLWSVSSPAWGLQAGGNANVGNDGLGLPLHEELPLLDAAPADAELVRLHKILHEAPMEQVNLLKYLLIVTENWEH